MRQQGEKEEGHMDIDEMELRLLKAYDEIRAGNTRIEEETAALEKETQISLDGIHTDIQAHIKDMRLQMSGLMSELRNDLENQAEEFRDDIRVDIKALETGDETERELKTEMRTLRKGLEEELTNMQQNLQSALETMGQTAGGNLSDIHERTEEELDVVLDEIWQQARTREIKRPVK